MQPRKSIEYGGLGQSGYTAGRNEHDRALDLELESEYLVYPRKADDDMLRDELGTDDRFTGRGGTVAHDHEKRDEPA